MSAPSILDIPALLAPIPGDDPAGSRVPHDTRRQFEDARKEDNPADFDQDDPSRHEKMRRADWPGIVRLAEKTLSEVSKDLLVAARLTEALVRLHGFGGLRDGLHLLRELVEQCWDRLNPPIDDGDLAPRAAPFYWLDEPDKGARLPNVLRSIPLIHGEGGGYGLITIRGMPPLQPPLAREEFDRALLTTSAEQCASVSEEIAACREGVEKLTASLTEKIGEGAPGLTSILQALEECSGLAREIQARKGPAASAETTASNGDSRPASAGGGPQRAPGSRAEAYQQLSRAATVLRELEPHSPIPHMVLRAVELGSLEFPELIKALIRDANVLSELKRETGIKDPPME